jgi:hypothetical protein
MSDMSALAAVSDSKPCKVCGEPIKKLARVCIHCNNYQDWRADLNISNTVLSLLVALFSVLTVALPAITTFITPKNSNLIFSFQVGTGNTISVLVTNTGIRPGAVHYLRAKSEDAPTIFPYITGQPSTVASVGNTDKSEASGTARVIEAGKSELISFYMLVDFTTALNKMIASSKQCILELAGTDFLGATTSKQVTIECKLLDQSLGPPPRVLPMPDQH